MKLVKNKFNTPTRMHAHTHRHKQHVLRVSSCGQCLQWRLGWWMMLLVAPGVTESNFCSSNPLGCWSIMTNKHWRGYTPSFISFQSVYSCLSQWKPMAHPPQCQVEILCSRTGKRRTHGFQEEPDSLSRFMTMKLTGLIWKVGDYSPNFLIWSMTRLLIVWLLSMYMCVYVCRALCMCAVWACIYVDAHVCKRALRPEEDIRCAVLSPSTLFPWGRVSHWIQSWANGQPSPRDPLVSVSHGTEVASTRTTLAWPFYFM